MEKEKCALSEIIENNKNDIENCVHCIKECVLKNLNVPDETKNEIMQRVLYEQIEGRR